MKRIIAATALLLTFATPAFADVSIIDAGSSTASANHSQSNSQTQTNNTDQSDNRGVTVNQGGGTANASTDDRGGNDDGALVNVQAPVAVATGPVLSPNVIVANNDILSNKSNSSSNSQTSSNSDSSTTSINQSKSYTVTDTSRSGNTASSIDRSVIFLPGRGDRAIDRDTDSVILLGSRRSCCSVKEIHEGGRLPVTGTRHAGLLLMLGLSLVGVGFVLDQAGRRFSL